MSEIDNLPSADGPKENEVTIDSKTNETDSNTSSSEEIASVNSEVTEAPIVEETKDETTSLNHAPTQDGTSNEEDEVINEIEESNAEDAEDEGNKDRHAIEVKEYDEMSLESLVIELEKLVKKEKVQAIKTHVDGIKNEFNSKFNTLLDEKKSEFLNDGGNEIDFYYSTPIQKRFKESYKEYKKKLAEKKERAQAAERKLAREKENALESASAQQKVFDKVIGDKEEGQEKSVVEQVVEQVAVVEEKKTKFMTDDIDKLNNKGRKLVTRIFGVIDTVLPKDLANIVKEKIKEELQ